MPLYSLNSLGLDYPARETQPELEAAEFWNLVRQELARLPKRERDAVRAYLGLSDQSCRSVARKYGTSPQTVCNWAKKAMSKLSLKLEAYR